MKRFRSTVLLASACAAAAVAGPSSAQATPLLTVGVEVESATTAQARYSLYVANRGDTVAQGVILTNAVPSNTTYFESNRTPLPPSSGTPCAGGAPAGTSCRWAIGDLAPGSSATVSVTYSLAQAAFTVSVSASAQLANAAPAGGDPSNSDGSLSRRVDELSKDAHADASQPTQNFGACPQLKVTRDNNVTAFLDHELGPGGMGTSIEKVWAAEIELTAESVLPPGANLPIGVHRTTTGDWDEGAGGCAGAAGSGRQVRGAARPLSDATPLATAQVAAPGLVRFDVTEALNTLDESYLAEGFELRAVSGSPGAATDSVAFSSSEAAANRPRLVWVRMNREGGLCIDADPEQGGGPSDRPKRVDAYLTDGTGRVTSSGVDGCPGFPLVDAPVGWELDDDSPDAYFSSFGGVPSSRTVGSSGDVGPDQGSTRTGAEGRTFAELSRAAPYEPIPPDAQNRIAGIALTGDPNGSIDPQTGAGEGEQEPDDQCAGASGPTPCSSMGETGEGDKEDDVFHAWSAPLDSGPPAQGGEQPGGEQPGGEQPGGEQPAPAARSVALTASAERAGVAQTVMLGGRVVSGAAGCAGPGEFVQIQRRLRGGRELADFASVSTEADGTFELPLLVDAGGDYVAVVPARPGCGEAASAVVPVLARGRVSAAATGTRKLVRGRRIRIHGRVAPLVRSAVVLERRTRRGWKRVGRKAIKGSATFSFPLTARWTGKRSFRVRWVSPGSMYLDAVSRRLTLRARRSR